MTNQAILEKAIEKAIAGGWNYAELGFSLKRAREYPQLLIFNHDFAKALWGEERVIFTQRDFKEGKTLGDNALPKYQYHLQQMVIADDPIKYLRENI